VRVASRTRRSPAKAREAVDVDTPARAATSLSTGRPAAGDEVRGAGDPS